MFDSMISYVSNLNWQKKNIWKNNLEDELRFTTSEFARKI